MSPLCPSVISHERSLASYFPCMQLFPLSLILLQIHTTNVRASQPTQTGFSFFVCRTCSGPADGRKVLLIPFMRACKEKSRCFVCVFFFLSCVLRLLTRARPKHFHESGHTPPGEYMVHLASLVLFNVVTKSLCSVFIFRGINLFSQVLFSLFLHL